MGVQLLDQWLLKEQKQKQENFRILNQYALREPEIIFVGDSMIDYYPVEELLVSQKSFVNRGIKGYKSYQILEHFSDHFFGRKLEKVFLLIGTNDLVTEKEQAEIIDNVYLTIQMLKREYPHILIHLISVLPVNEHPNYKGTVYIRKNSDIQDLNQSYKSLSQQIESVKYIDVYNCFLDQAGQLKETYTVDGLHLNIEGYIVLSKELQKYL